MERLCDVLEVRRGVTAVIGGGGKTSLLYRLASELRERGMVLVATTTRILPPAHLPVRHDREGTLRALRVNGIACAGTPTEGGKLAEPSFADWMTLADYTLVEADGSKGLPLKAHAPHEPVIPANAQRVVLVVGADGFGKPIRDVCHRSERYAALCGVSENALVTPELEAALILAEGLGDRVYINKVETAEDYDRAAALANRLTCPVTAGSLHKGVYLCLR